MGRRAEVATIRRHLTDSRLVTLTGVGGVGKTRLACRVASELRRVYSDGIWFIDLSELGRDEMVPAAVADAMGVGSGPADTALCESLARRNALVVLDNCEHVLDACSRLAHKILASAPRVRILTTSREPLSVLGETIFNVAPLSLAVTGGRGVATTPLPNSEAVELFEARAQAVQPEFVMDAATRRAVAELCELLDGIPLAIELAAFQVRSFPVDHFLTLRGSVFGLLTRGNRAASSRHRTLEGTLEWSYALCSPGEQSLWARLSVFTGTFDIDAVYNVCGRGLDDTETLVNFSRLIEKSIVVVIGGGTARRYRLLESIKYFGAAKLVELGQSDRWRRQHRDYYLCVALTSEAHTSTAGQVEWNARLEENFPNIRSALDFCFAVAGEYETGLRMACSLWFFWNASGHLRDGRHWLGRALDLATEASPERAKALWAVGWYAMVQGDADTATHSLRACVELADRIGDEHARARAIQFQGTVEQTRGDLESARDLLVAAMTGHEKAQHDDVLTILCGAQLGFVYCVLGDHDEALDHARAAISTGRRRGEQFGTSWALWTRGLIAWSTGDFATAAVVLREAIGLKRELRDWLGTAACVELLSWLSTEDGDHPRAALLLGVGRAFCGELGSSPLFGDVTLTRTRERYERTVRETLGSLDFEKQLAAGEALDHQAAFALIVDGGPEREPAHDTTGSAGPLTRREAEVARLIVAGMSNKEIAECLVISRRTVEGHVERALVKTGFRSRSQLAAWVATEDAAGDRGPSRA
ncbi:MAG: hypothetical protein ABS81_01030 [Pseudonocardia sp. SCN 72-86]|nr:MAG: hypothetical protein ABS81_01030 [Pseudonocardia sp. SCN 72-86]